MLAGLSVAVALLAPAASAAPVSSGAANPAPAPAAAPTQSEYGPAAPPPPPKKAVKTASDGCATARASANTREIVICAQRPQGYRLNPDILEAKREMHNGGRPHNPHEMYRDNSCATVGPMGCRGQAGINLLAAAVTLATMADRLSKGQEIGSMFVTDPHPTEYQLYVEAKRRREAREAEAAAKAKAKAAQQAAQASGKVDAVQTKASPAQ
jgi:hypothetical protein